MYILKTFAQTIEVHVFRDGNNVRLSQRNSDGAMVLCDTNMRSISIDI